MARAHLALATGAREVIRTDIVVRNGRGVDCYSTNSLDLAERWANANVERGPFTIEKIQQVRLRTVLATVEAPGSEDQAPAAISSNGAA